MTCGWVIARHVFSNPSELQKQGNRPRKVKASLNRKFLCARQTRAVPLWHFCSRNFRFQSSSQTRECLKSPSPVTHSFWLITRMFLSLHPCLTGRFPQGECCFKSWNMRAGRDRKDNPVLCVHPTERGSHGGAWRGHGISEHTVEQRLSWTLPSKFVLKLGYNLNQFYIKTNKDTVWWCRMPNMCEFVKEIVMCWPILNSQ